LEVVGDGVFRAHKCAALQDVQHETLAKLRYDEALAKACYSMAERGLEQVLDGLFGKGTFATLPPATREQLAPIIERAATGALAPDDWEQLANIIGDAFT